MGDAATSSLGLAPVVVLIVYVLLLIALALYGWIKSKMTEDDYYLAGRRQNLLITALTIMATFFSSAALLGIPGAIYKDGVAFMFFALNLPLSGAAVYVLGSRITRIGRAKGYVTPADMLADYYGQSHLLRLLVALAGALYVVPYVIVQVRAGGHLAAQFFPGVGEISFLGASLDVFDVGAIVLGLVMTLYVLVGGMRSVALTDALQGALLLFGMLVAGAAIISAFGGVRDYFAAISELPRDALRLPGPSGRYSPWLLMTICAFSSLASMIQPAQWMRYYAARSTRVLRNSALLFALLLPFCFLFGVMLVGLGARALYPPTTAAGEVVAHPEVGDHDQALVAVLLNHGPELFGAAGAAIISIILVAILAASMSTADSNLHALSAVLTRDIYDKFIHRGASERERAWVGRVVIVLAAAFSLWLVHVGERNPEFAPLKMIIEMLYVAMAFSCQVLPAALDMLFIRKGTKAGAIAGLAAGLLVVLCFTPAPQLLLGAGAAEPVTDVVAWLKGLFDIGFVGFAVNAVVFVVVSLFTKPLDQRHVQEFGALMDAEAATAPEADTPHA